MLGGKTCFSYSQSAVKGSQGRSCSSDWRSAAYWPVFHAWFSFLACTTQGLLPKGGSAHSGLDLPA